MHTLRKVKLKKKKFLFSRSPCCCFKTRLSEFSKQDLELALSREILEWKKMLERKEN